MILGALAAMAQTKEYPR
ncbi:hypothetical protein LINPERPRIM_LOCUS44239 [Linum perenne]